mgnify:CR=1 FL=1
MKYEEVVDSGYKIIEYSEEWHETWDNFVEYSLNGTFLQSRRFLSYHPKDRFRDSSLIFLDKKNNIVAVCPACEIYEGERKIFYSHKGSTYGGLVLSDKIYKAKHLVPLIKLFEEYLQRRDFQQVYLKITPDIFCTCNMSLLEYALYFCGFNEFKDLNTYIDYTLYKDPVESNFTQGKRSHINKCIREGMKASIITTDDEVREYYDILCENLIKYDLKPVHTVDELLDFKNSRLQNECQFFGTYLNDEMIAGGMIFIFKRTKIAHTQYLSAKSKYLKLGSASFLYYSVIEAIKKQGFEKLSWGVCTENYGKYLNDGLISSKEDYGSMYSNNLTYFKSLQGK